MKVARSIPIAILSMITLTGCFELHHGHYVAAKVPGWSRSEYAGSYLFHYHTKHTPSWFIQVGGGQKGKLFLRIGSNAYDPDVIWKPGALHFSKQPIRVKFINQNKETIIPSDNFQKPFLQELDIGNSEDFVVTVPSFEIMSNTVPQLILHVQWSEGKYLVWIPLQ